MKHVTGGGERLVTAVDYVTGVLVHDQVETLQQIVEDFARDHTTRVRLTSYLELVRNFYKHHVDKHIVKEGNDVCWHGIEYGLSVEAQQPRTGRCRACLFPFYFFKLLKKEIADSTTGDNPRMTKSLADDALRFVVGAKEKLEIYRAHRVRVSNQQHEIDKIHRELERE